MQSELLATGINCLETQFVDLPHDRLTEVEVAASDYRARKNWQTIVQYLTCHFCLLIFYLQIFCLLFFLPFDFSAIWFSAFWIPLFDFLPFDFLPYISDPLRQLSSLSSRTKWQRLPAGNTLRTWQQFLYYQCYFTYYWPTKIYLYRSEPSTTHYKHLSIHK